MFGWRRTAQYGNPGKRNIGLRVHQAQGHSCAVVQATRGAGLDGEAFLLRQIRGTSGCFRRIANIGEPWNMNQVGKRARIFS
jgi:hypothetical protein